MYKKKKHPEIKSNLHYRNKHRSRYDFKNLVISYPVLEYFVKENKFGDDSIDFSDPKAVLTLNTALLKHYYKINYWEIPNKYLCPPIPGRADYIHYLSDLIGLSNKSKAKKYKGIRCLDIGVGANCIYPIIGVNEYGWSFVGVDVDSTAIQSAKKIIDNNLLLKDKVELRLQKNPNNIFNGIIKNNDFFNLTMCNPPFHSSKEEATSASLRKVRNLKNNRIKKPSLNFGGQSNELWFPGGEVKFVKNMISESKYFAKSCQWFTTLISKKSNLSSIYKALKEVKAVDVKTIPMGQGNKISRIVAWTFYK